MSNRGSDGAEHTARTMHVCRAYTRATGTLVLRGENGAVIDSEFKTESQDPETFECSCGVEFESQSEAKEHLQEATKNGASN